VVRIDEYVQNHLNIDDNPRIIVDPFSQEVAYEVPLQFDDGKGGNRLGIFWWVDKEEKSGRRPTLDEYIGAVRSFMQSKSKTQFKGTIDMT